MIIKHVSIALVSVFILSVTTVPLVVSAQSENARNQVRETRGLSEEKRQRIDKSRTEKRDEIQLKVTERQAKVKPDVCERRQDQLARKIPKLTTQTTRLLGVIDTMYERVQEFYESGQLTVENYNDLKAKVDAAQIKAYAVTENVAAYDFDFDCENDSVGEQTYAFRLAVSEARGSLKEYRSELVVLISSLRAAAAESGDAVDDASEEAPIREEETIDEE